MDVKSSRVYIFVMELLLNSIMPRLFPPIQKADAKKLKTRS